jgi:predicted alpha-1,2-mannosidase
MRHCRTAALVALTLIACVGQRAGAASAFNPSQYVSPFIGSDGTGHTFPGATLPFGMVAPSPDNADSGWDYTSGYQFRAAEIIGFSNTHISGAGIPELGDLRLLPSSGSRWNAATSAFASHYDKRSEQAHPGYYAVTLSESAVRVELTATPHVAVQKYTFAHSGKVQVLADFQFGLRNVTGPQVTASEVAPNDSNAEFSGTIHSKNWVEREASFVLQFNHAWTRAERLPAKPGELAPRYLLTFDVGRTRALEARVAMSTVDVAGARGNLAESARRDFAALRADAERAWNDLLGRVQISAPARTKRIFYTALYHAFVHPSDIADVDGRVRGPTGEVIAARGGHYYSTLSLWDTFRAQQPLLTLLVPERVDGIVETLLEHHRAAGNLPVWTAWGRETWCMIGNPALPIIADAIAKGFTGFDQEEALAAMVTTSTQPRPHAPDWAQFDWAPLDRYGYLPFDLVPGESVSKTLEAGIGDDAVARVARALGKNDIAQKFAQRAQGYRKLFDPATRVMRGRDAQGNWRTPFDPLLATSPLNNPGDYTEANAWQYSLTPALHDPHGMLALLGGAKAFGDYLDTFFTLQVAHPDKLLGQEAMIGQYAHGNEPSHHIAWLYALSDRPWRGHARIAQLVRDFYSDRPDGIVGNDDCGQMSAWYVFATLGFYPAEPASGRYTLGAPQVVAASIHLHNGKTLQIRAKGFGNDHPYARQVRFHGRTIDTYDLAHADLIGGGTLEFDMAPLPTTQH